MKIINNTNLDYSTIGLIIDNIIKNSAGDTIYYGKIDILKIEVGIYNIRVQIRYLKRYVEWRFDEVE